MGGHLRSDAPVCLSGLGFMRQSAQICSSMCRPHRTRRSTMRSFATCKCVAHGRGCSAQLFLCQPVVSGCVPRGVQWCYCNCPRDLMPNVSAISRWTPLFPRSAEAKKLRTLEVERGGRARPRAFWVVKLGLESGLSKR